MHLSDLGNVPESGATYTGNGTSQARPVITMRLPWLPAMTCTSRGSLLVDARFAQAHSR